MDTRYQIFLSSTYSDLTSERKAIWDNLVKEGFIVVGMEQFPASDAEQMEYIRPLIDESDYYVLVIKGRYGSIAMDGVSFTEKEYMYALSQGKPILAFLYNDVGNLKVSETDQDPLSQAKLLALRKSLLEKRIVKLWRDERELAQEVMRSVHEIVRRKPAKGWVRGDRVIDTETIRELAELRRNIEKYKMEIEEMKNAEKRTPEGLQQGEDNFLINYYVLSSETREGKRFDVREGPFTYTTTWERAFSNISDMLYDEPSEATIERFMSTRITKYHKSTGAMKGTIWFEEKPSKIMRIQYEALGYINTFVHHDKEPETGEPYKFLCWKLSELGKRQIMKALARRKDAD